MVSITNIYSSLLCKLPVNLKFEQKSWVPVLQVLFALCYLCFIVPFVLKLLPRCNYIFDPDNFSWTYLTTDSDLSLVMNKLGNVTYLGRNVIARSKWWVSRKLPCFGYSRVVSGNVCLHLHIYWILCEFFHISATRWHFTNVFFFSEQHKT